MSKTDWVACPHCGEEIKRDAKACRHCGSDENTGWSEGTYLDGIDLPEEGAYADNLEREGFQKSKPGQGRIFFGAVAVVLILIFAAWLIRQAGF
jgi:uncharacterized membrane protein YvbJ